MLLFSLLDYAGFTSTLCSLSVAVTNQAKQKYGIHFNILMQLFTQIVVLIK